METSNKNFPFKKNNHQKKKKSKKPKGQIKALKSSFPMSVFVFGAAAFAVLQ